MSTGMGNVRDIRTNSHRHTGPHISQVYCYKNAISDMKLLSFRSVAYKVETCTDGSTKSVGKYSFYCSTVYACNLILFKLPTALQLQRYAEMKGAKSTLNHPTTSAMIVSVTLWYKHNSNV